MRRGGTWIQRWRVPLGFLCGAGFILLAQPQPMTMAIGAIVALLGIALRAWAAGHIRKNAQLATTGPYAHTRNPLYLGSFLLGLGFTIAANRLVLGLLFTVFFLSIYLPVMRAEARTLGELFGAEYQRYASAVPLLVPHLTPYMNAESASASKFDINLYIRYREYRAALGTLIAWSVLALKAMIAK